MCRLGMFTVSAGCLKITQMSIICKENSFFFNKSMKRVFVDVTEGVQSFDCAHVFVTI